MSDRIARDEGADARALDACAVPSCSQASGIGVANDAGDAVEPASDRVNVFEHFARALVRAAALHEPAAAPGPRRDHAMTSELLARHRTSLEILIASVYHEGYAAGFDTGALEAREHAGTELLRLPGRPR